jgi:hypothetical protein
LTKKSSIPQDPYIEELLQQSVPGKRVTLDLSSRDKADPSGVDESSSEDEDEEVSSGNNDTTAVEATDELKESESSNDNLPLQLPTPESTPIPEHTTPTSSKEVFGDVSDPRNIVNGPKRRRPSSRRHEAHTTDLATPGDFPGFNAALSAALLQPEKFHRDQLPPEPWNWREMKNPPH